MRVEKLVQYCLRKLAIEVKHTDCRKLRSDMQDHNYGHSKRNDMHKRCGTFKNDCIGNLNIPGITVGNDAGSPGD